jgi:hypothetical protein
VQKSDGTPIEGVTVSVDGKGWDGVTDASGNFDFGEVPPDTYTVSGEKSCCAPASQTQNAPLGSATQFTLVMTTCSITSETVATAPPSRNRKKVGVGEEVTLTFSLGNASWTTSGGKLSSTSGPSVTFAAPDRAASVTVTASGSSCTCAITFDVVEPSEARRQQKPGTGIEHTKNRPDIGIATDLYLFPDDVCFYNVEYKEKDVIAVTSGVYDQRPLKGMGHHPSRNFWTFSMTVVSGLGTKVNSPGDQAYSGDPMTPAPFAPGSISFDIPYVFRVAGGAEKQFATVRQIHTLANDGTLTVSKAGATATLQVSSDSSSF